MSRSHALLAAAIAGLPLAAAAQSAPATASCLLVHVTSGPEDPTKSALAFLVARTAADGGWPVRVFLAGDAASLVRDAVIDGTVGLGTGRLREHYDAIVAKGGRFYVSGLSARARGITEADVAGKPAEMAMPAVLVRLVQECSRTIVY
jgi:predicted peroxiredoxin